MQIYSAAIGENKNDFDPTRCLFCVYMFCTDLRINSALCVIVRNRIGFV